MYEYETKQLFQKSLKKIHYTIISCISLRKNLSFDYQLVLPKILYQILFLLHQTDISNTSKETLNNVNLLNITVNVVEKESQYPYFVHFSCFNEFFKLSYEAYNQYCLQVHIGAIKCLNFDEKLLYISETIESISNLCFSNCGIKLDALKHLTECVTYMTKSQWNNLSHYVYKVVMGLMTHSLPAIHDQCVVLFKKCIALENLDFILDIVMSEISWSLRIKYFMLTEIAPVYGIKKVISLYKIKVLF